MAKKNKQTTYKDLIQLKNITLTQSQQEFHDKIKNNTIIFCYGPAGTSKTFTALFASLKLFLENNKLNRIFLTKPIQESGESLGFLKGGVEDKVAEYVASFYDTFAKIIDSKDLGMLIQENYLTFKPLAFMRGSTFDDCLMILDESQNCDFRQLQLYISRMGKNTKVIVLGDVSQYDIKENKIALPKFIEMIQDIKGISTHEFTKDDIVRNPILVQITERYEKWKSEGKITPSK